MVFRVVRSLIHTFVKKKLFNNVVYKGIMKSVFTQHVIIALANIRKFRWLYDFQFSSSSVCAIILTPGRTNSHPVSL